MAESKADQRGIPEMGRGLWDLVVAYIKQETVVPVKALGRYVAFGAAGSLLGGIGSVLVIVAVLRLLQEDTGSAFAGAHSWMPYAICTVLGGVIVALAVLRTVRPAPDHRASR